MEGFSGSLYNWLTASQKSVIRSRLWNCYSLVRQHRRHGFFFQEWSNSLFHCYETIYCFDSKNVLLQKLQWKCLHENNHNSSRKRPQQLWGRWPLTGASIVDNQQWEVVFRNAVTGCVWRSNVALPVHDVHCKSIYRTKMRFPLGCPLTGTQKQRLSTL